MGSVRYDIEPMCETSEKGERHFSSEELLPKKLEVGERLLGLLGFQSIATIVFRLRSTHREVAAVINGERLPSGEMLLSIRKVTGVSIDWLLTGIGQKFPATAQPNPAPTISTFEMPVLQLSGGDVSFNPDT